MRGRSRLKVRILPSAPVGARRSDESAPVHQRLYVYPDHGAVIVLFASHPLPVAVQVEEPHRRGIAALLARLQQPM